jgi:membrane-associated phospholipid phosphatase
MFIYNSAGPRNALPSMHCLMCWVAICGARGEKKMPLYGKISIWVISIAIILSTQTTKQHYIIDTIAALLMCEAVFWILKKTKIATWVQNIFTKLNTRLKIDWNELPRI